MRFLSPTSGQLTTSARPTPVRRITSTRRQIQNLWLMLAGKINSALQSGRQQRMFRRGTKLQPSVLKSFKPQCLTHVKCFLYLQEHMRTFTGHKTQERALAAHGNLSSIANYRTKSSRSISKFLHICSTNSHRAPDDVLPNFTGKNSTTVKVTATFEVLSAVLMLTEVFLRVTLCFFSVTYRRFEGS